MKEYIKRNQALPPALYVKAEEIIGKLIEEFKPELKKITESV